MNCFKCFRAVHEKVKNQQPLMSAFVRKLAKLQVFLFAVMFFETNIPSAMSQQTATNFNVTSCNSQNYELFEMLDAGNVVVLCFVMPCGSCVTPAKTAYNVSNSFESTYPGKVKFFLCDDYGTSPCNTMNSFANNYGLSNAIVLSTPDCIMTDYGSAAMPKIVVLAGKEHLVIDVQNLGTGVQGEVNTQQLNEAILTAITNSDPMSVSCVENEVKNMVIYPNPACNNILYIENRDEDISFSTIDIYDLSGKWIASPATNKHDGHITINISALHAGTYFLKIHDSKGTLPVTRKFIKP